LYRLGLLLLVVIPFLPVIIILVIAFLAELKGCRPDQKEICQFGSVPVSDILAFILQASAGSIIAGIRQSHLGFVFFYSVIAGWLVACLVVLTLGWRRMISRVFLGFAVTLIFALLPYFGFMLAMAPLMNEACRPNEGNVGACIMFGGYVGSPDYSPAHDGVALGWLASYGVPLTLAIYVIFLLLVIVFGVLVKNRPSASGQ
jgi:hypothetical protein